MALVNFDALLHAIDFSTAAGGVLSGYLALAALGLAVMGGYQVLKATGLVEGLDLENDYRETVQAMDDEEFKALTKELDRIDKRDQMNAYRKKWKDEGFID